MPIELLENPHLFLCPILDLSALQIEQVPFGSKGAAIPRKRIVSVAGSPIVHSYRDGINGAPEPLDHSGRQLSLSDVIESVMSADGMVYFDSKISFKLVGGLVAGFAIYGPLLAHFSYLTTYAAFCAAFSAPDRVQTNEAYGELMGYNHYYFGSRKCAVWDAFDSQISLINLGAYPGNDPS